MSDPANSSVISNMESNTFTQEITEIIHNKQKEIENARLLKLEKDIVEHCMEGKTELYIYPLNSINPDKVKEIYEGKGYKWELVGDEQRLSWDKDSTLDAGRAYCMAMKYAEQIKTETSNMVNGFVKQIMEALMWHARMYGVTKIHFREGKNYVSIGKYPTEFVFHDISHILAKLRHNSGIIDDIRAVLNKEDIDITVVEYADIDDDGCYLHDPWDDMITETIITIFSSIDDKKESVTDLTCGKKLLLEAEHGKKYMSRIKEGKDEDVLLEYQQIKSACEKAAQKGEIGMKVVSKSHDHHLLGPKLKALCIKDGFEIQTSYNILSIFTVFWNNAESGTEAYRFLELSKKAIEDKRRDAELKLNMRRPLVVMEMVTYIQELMKLHIKENGNIPLELNNVYHSNILKNLEKYKCFDEIKKSLPKCIEFESVEREYEDCYGVSGLRTYYYLNVNINK